MFCFYAFDRMIIYQLHLTGNVIQLILCHSMSRGSVLGVDDWLLANVFLWLQIHNIRVVRDLLPFN